MRVMDVHVYMRDRVGSGAAQTLKHISRYCTFSECFFMSALCLRLLRIVSAGVPGWVKERECLRKSKETLNSLEGVFL